MREILELCIELDRMAFDAYTALSRLTNDEELRRNFDHLAKEERVHVEWWTELLLAWEAGLLPDIADEHHLLERLEEMRSELKDSIPEGLTEISIDDALDLAVHFEFYMLDPLFGELVDLMKPGGRVAVRESYSRHVLRLIELVEKRYTRRGSAKFLAGVLHRAYRDQQRLAALAMRDPLTGHYNRRGLLGYLNQWLSWSWRYGRPVGVVLLDVDRFKQINDSYGHDVGDEALVAVSEALADTVRSSDVVGRFGGDEFIVLAPEADGQELDALMDRIVTAVGQKALKAGAGEIKLSVSVGGAWAPGGVEVAPEILVAEADRSMYLAKEAGRNRAGDVLSAISV